MVSVMVWWVAGTDGSEACQILGVSYRGDESPIPGEFPPSWPSPHPFMQWGPN